MKKKLLLNVILFILLFVSVLSFTSTSKAVDISDPDLELDATQQKEILAAYDLDKNGIIQSRDVTKMKQEIQKNGQRKYTNNEAYLLQRLCVFDCKFTWSEATVNRLRYFYRYIDMGQLLYIEYFPNGSGKIIAHINNHGRFIRVTYDYEKYGGRF